jgi:hypothetical protein
MRSRSAFSADDHASELQVALCADDYGIAPGVGVAVRDLLAHGRLSATSCMAASPHWPEEAVKLKALAGGDAGFEVGLHLVLTDQAPLAPMPRTAPLGRLPSLPHLLGLAMSRTLDAAEVAAEMERQLDAFEAAWGGPPAFVDGHQHAHQLPVIRRALLDLYERRLRPHRVRVRYCVRPVADITRAGVAVPRALVIAALGRAWARAGRTAGVPGNRHFAGVRGPAEREAFGDQLRAWLATARPGTLIMCHPGSVDAVLIAADPLTTPREGEYAFLAGDGWPRLLGETGVALVVPGRLDGTEKAEGGRR